MTVDPAGGGGLFDVVPVAIGEYEDHEPLPGVAAELAAVLDVLDQLGGVARPWDADRAPDLSAVNRRLATWANPPRPRSSALVWIGHGGSDGDRAWLAVHDTLNGSAGTGLGPATLAEHIADEWRRRAADEAAWALVVIHACGAGTFARLLGSDLLARHDDPRRLVVVAVGDDGAAHLGRLSAALAATVGSYTDNDTEVHLRDLAGRLDAYLSRVGRVLPFAVHDAAPLRLRHVLPAAITATIDVYAELRAFLSTLPDDQRGHFLPKAQGAEQGELAWYFVGRAGERRRIATWLREHGAGMLVVTGRAGSGKSALLGNILAYTNPDLRDLLIRAGHLDHIGPGDRPPDQVFDAVVHLTGLTASDLVRRLAAAAGLGDPPATDSGQDVPWLLEHLRRRPFTVLVDALDEAQDPTVIAGSILRGLAGLPRGRVVVGTRASTLEGPDQPDTPDENLLDALGRAATTTILRVERDPAAVARYVIRRLTAARDNAARDNAAAGRVDVEDATITTVADLIAGAGRQFLFARLAVHEILARPDLLLPASRTTLTDLLRGDHRSLFAAAVARLAAQAPAADPLLEALALARGRGMPRADRIWAIAATALAEDRFQVTEQDIDALLDAAAPYVMLDAEYGQSVYRLAHRTFQEHFLSRADTP